MYPTNDYNLRFFFYMATGPNHDKFSATTLITDKSSFYLSGDTAQTTVEPSNKTKVDFIRHHDER